MSDPSQEPSQKKPGAFSGLMGRIAEKALYALIFWGVGTAVVGGALYLWMGVLSQALAMAAVLVVLLILLGLVGGIG